MRNFKIFLLLFIPILSQSQPLGTWPVAYGDAAPTHTPSGSGTRLFFNITTNDLYTWAPAPTSAWIKFPKSFDQISGCTSPAYTPTARQSLFAVNSCLPKPELYQYVSGAWRLLNPETLYTAGTGIDITGGVISNTIPRLIIQDEGTSLADPIVRLNFVGDGIAAETVFASQTGTITLDSDLNNLANNATNGLLTRTGVGAGGVTGRAIIAGAGISVSNGSGVSGNPTITNTGDLSTTNELQTLSIVGQDLTLSGGGGTVEIPAGADGNGIYGGNGTIAPSAEATLTEESSFKILWANSNVAVNVSDEENLLEFKSKEGLSSFAFFSDGLAFTASNYTLFSSEGSDNGALIYQDKNPLTSPTGGIKYAADYSADFTDRSLVDREYVDSHSGSALGGGFTEGGGDGEIPDQTTITSNYFGYPVTLSFDDDIIDNFDGYKFIGWTAGAGSGQIQIGIRDNFGDPEALFIAGASGSPNSSVNLGINRAGLTSTNGSGNITSIESRANLIDISMSGNSTAVITDNTADVFGLQYATDYSTTILANERSIPDMGTTRKAFGYSGTISTTTNGSGEITITHSIGTTPTAVSATYIGNNAYFVTITARSSTTFTAKVWSSTLGTAVASTGVQIDWYAR